MEERKWNISLIDQNDKRKSELCKAKDVQADWYKRWCKELNEEPKYHRKQWEFVYIMQALWERGCIEKDKKGIGFAVGSEPIPSVFAGGCPHLFLDRFHLFLQTIAATYWLPISFRSREKKKGGRMQTSCVLELTLLIREDYVLMKLFAGL